MLLLFLLIFSFFRGHQASSCDNITGLQWPFVWKGDHRLQYKFELDCIKNRTIIMWPLDFSSDNKVLLYVLEINYEEQWLRVVDPMSISGHRNLSSCPVQHSILHNLPFSLMNSTLWYISLMSYNNIHVAFIHCVSRVNSLRYVEAPFCGNRTMAYMFSNSSPFYSYVVVVDQFEQLDILEESCTIDRIGYASSISDDSNIFNGLAYGFKLKWFKFQSLDPCNLLDGLKYLPWNPIDYNFNISQLKYEYGFFGDGCNLQIWIVVIQRLITIILGCLKALEFVIGFPVLFCLVVYKWRRRHLCMDEKIENFLRDQNHLTPIKYRYSEVKKMTNNFNMRLGEGAYGIVYKGNLRSGSCVAIKMMKQFMASEKEFINEFSTLGHIHHCNIVQLIGFCMEGTKCGLVYELLPNGSLDRYIFSQQSLGNSALKYKKLYEIAVGVARGVNYLHHGCQRQILHFDIKPHNILLNDKFNPKISDFGLAQLYESNDSVINLTTARGTVGYMAPEMFYKNIGNISRKADIYSFGMLLMEMVGRRINIDPLSEKTSQIYFSSCVYDHVSAKKDLDINDATEEERKMVMRTIIVALWCIQMKPCDRPPMNKVVEMLEGNFELPMPPKPFVAPRESVDDQHITTTYSVDYVVELTSN